MNSNYTLNQTGQQIQADLDKIEQMPEPSNVQEKLTAGSNINISNNTISATDTTYSAGSGINISNNTISVDNTIVQEKLVSGTNIKTVNNNSLLGEGNISIAGEPNAYLKNAELSNSNNTLTLIKKDDSTVIFNNTVYSEATTSVPGLMSSSDKTKIDSYEEGPQLGTDTTKYLRNDGQWSVPSVSIPVQDVQMNGTSILSSGIANIRSGEGIQFNADTIEIDPNIVQYALEAGTGINISQDVISVNTSALSYNDLQNKPTVDQSYNASSSNAQSGTAVASAISGKQDTISDLSSIRSGASAGATAVQPSALSNYATQTDLQQGLATKETVGVAYTKAESNNLLANKLDATKCTLQTTAPTSAISDGGVHIVILDSAPATECNGYIYLIKE